MPSTRICTREITGWALARARVAAVEIAIAGQSVAVADHGLRRLDIRAAFPDWEGSLGSGFSAVLPHRILPSGTHTVTVTLRDNGGGTLGTEFRIDVEELPEATGPWSLRRRMPHGEADLGRRLIERSGRGVDGDLHLIARGCCGASGRVDRAVANQKQSPAESDPCRHPPHHPLHRPRHVDIQAGDEAVAAWLRGPCR